MRFHLSAIIFRYNPQIHFIFFFRRMDIRESIIQNFIVIAINSILLRKKKLLLLKLNCTGSKLFFSIILFCN